MTSDRICDQCPAPAAIFMPGQDEERDIKFFGLLLHRGTPLQCLCLNCWLKQVGTIPEEAN